MNPFQNNLAALRTVQPGLARRLARTQIGGHVSTSPDGATTWLNHGTALRLRLSPEQRETLLERVRDGVEPLFVGLGEGEFLAGLPGRRHAFERDPSLLRRFLTHHDVSEDLATGRLVLWMGADLLGLSPEQVQVISHPVLGQPYRWELEAWRSRSSRHAMLALGGLMVSDLRQELEDQGFAVWPLDHQRLAPAELEHCMAAWAPELVVTVNHVRGLSEACQRHDTRLWVWEIDPSLEAIRPERGSHHHTLLSTWRQAQVPEWRAAGFSRAEYLPLAAAAHRKPRILDAEDLVRYDAPVAFVGASLVDNVPRCKRLAEGALTGFTGDPAQAGAVLSRVLAGQRADWSRFQVPELLEEHVPGFLAWMQTRSPVDPVQLIGELSACEKRLNAVATLAPLGIHVWGDAGWRQLEPHGVQVRGPVGHHQQLTRLYNAAPLQLDVGRLYQQDIVTLRVFDAAATGACVLTEPSSALSALFEPEVEVVTWRTLGELRQKTEYLINHPEKAAAIGARARQRVERDHRMRARVVHALQTLALDRPAEEQHTQRRQRSLDPAVP